MRKVSLTLTALSAALVLPMAGVYAQDKSKSTMNDVPAMHDTAMVMDASQFRDTLYRVRELFSDMRKHDRLANATNDPLLRAQHQEEDRTMLNESISLLDSILGNWKYGDVQRMATEGDDTAYVRLTVWDLRNMLAADKLNGRDAIINTEVWNLLKSAIERAESPGFRVSDVGVSTRIASRDITWSSSGGDTSIPHFDNGSGYEYVRTERTDANRTEIPPIATRPEVTTTTREETTEVTPTPAPATTEETTVVPESPLPRTGGDPAMLFLMGSTLIGTGSLLRRRRR